jgi:hypothetical protein
VIVIQRGQRSASPFGSSDGPVTWSDHLRLRAERVEPSTDEFLTDSGVRDHEVVVFRTRWVTDIMASDRVVFAGRAYNIKAIAEVGHRVGLELRCISHTGAP